MSTKTKAKTLGECMKCKHHLEHDDKRVLCNRAGGRSPGYVLIMPSNWNDGIKNAVPIVHCLDVGGDV